MQRHHGQERQSQSRGLGIVHRVTRTTNHEPDPRFASRVFLCTTHKQRMEITHEKVYIPILVRLLSTCGIHGPRFTVQGPRCCGSATMTRARRLNRCVRTLKNVCALHNPIRAHTIVNVINDLCKCVRCVRCVLAFSSSFTDLIDIPLLFFKSNFDQNKCAHTAHISRTRIVADFLLFQSAHTFAHTLRTHPLLSAHIPKSRPLCPLTVNHESR